MQAIVLPLVLVVNGLAAGVLVGSHLGGYALLSALPANRYVHAHAFFSTRYDPFMPVCLLATVVGDLVLAVAAPSALLAALFGVGGLLAAATVTISLTKNVPINKWVRTLDPERLPTDFAKLDRRSEWGRWNLIRGCAAVAALIANCAAVACSL